MPIIRSLLLVATFALPSVALSAPKVLGTSPDGFLSIDKQNNLWGTNKTEGAYGQRIVKFERNGDGFIRTAYTSSLVKALKPKGSQVQHNVKGRIDQVWPLKDGNVLFMADVLGKGFLYKLNTKTNRVGNNKRLYNNRQAVLNVGERFDPVLKKKVHYKDVRALHQRSLLEATVAGKTVLFFAEYNVNHQRKPGGAGDAVALWKSTDMGDTWIKVVEWNLKGKHVISHIHGLKQNPYNGWIYILVGDSDKESGIIAWDGKSKPLPDNMPLAKIGLGVNYPGWRALTGSAVRTGDIVFTRKHCIWLPDYEPKTLGETVFGQQANHDLTKLKATSPIQYQRGSSPILAQTDAAGIVYWISYRSTANNGAYQAGGTGYLSRERIHVWTSEDEGSTWQAPIPIDIYNAYAAVPQNMMLTPWNTLIVGSRGLVFNRKASYTGSSVSIQLSKRRYN